MNPWIVAFLSICFSTALTAQISLPRLGFAQDRAACLRPVHGVLGSFVIGEPVARDVVSFGTDNTLLVIKTADHLIAFDAGLNETWRRTAPAGPAQIYFDKVGSAWTAFFPDAEETWRWNGQDVDVERSASNALSRPATIEGDEVVVSGSRVRIRLPEPIVSVQQMGRGLLLLKASERSYALQTDAGEERLYRLPEVTQ